MEGMTERGTRAQIEALRDRMGEAIIGQREVIERLLIGLLANGNLLVEGLPGLAKTRAIKALAKNLECAFSRIQFTPDLLPSDVTGTEIYARYGEALKTAAKEAKDALAALELILPAIPVPRFVSQLLSGFPSKALG